MNELIRKLLSLSLSRCLIPCALYEQFWAKYARYLEKAHKEKRDLPPSHHADMGDEIGEDGIRKARSAFNTGLNKVRNNMKCFTIRRTYLIQ